MTEPIGGSTVIRGDLLLETPGGPVANKDVSGAIEIRSLPRVLAGTDNGGVATDRHGPAKKIRSCGAILRNQLLLLLPDGIGRCARRSERGYAGCKRRRQSVY